MLKRVTYKDIAKFSWAYWKRRKALGFWALFFLSLSTLIDVVFPTYVGLLVDAFTGNFQENSAQAVRLIIIVLALAFGFFLMRWLSFRAYNVYECFSMRDILIDALEKVQRFSTDWHSNNFAGGTVRKITRARTAFEMFEDTLVLGFFPAFIIFFGISGLLILKLPMVGLFVFVTAMAYCAFSIFVSIYLLAPRYLVSANADTRIGAILSDIISGSQTVKSFGAEQREDGLFYDTAEDWRVKTTHSYRFTNDMDMVRNALNFIMLGGMLGLTFLQWQKGNASPGDITMVITSYFMINGYLREIGRHVSNLQKAMSDMEDVVFFWKTDVAVKDKPGAAIFKPGAGEIVFDNIRFAYNNQDDSIYENFSIHLRPGEKVALVGHSGSGKSTFVKLLQRLYDIQSGEIRIDGQNIADVTQSSLRKAIALVPQDPILFHRTLMQNIAYGNEDAGEAEIIQAAQKAYAHDFIMSLPQGYDTLVGERGIKLSGGERQRVAIARAILSNAPILILDEATSSLDSISEHYIQMALQELMRGRTTITIAHRLSTIKDVDRILVFDQGRIVEQGTHSELLQNEESHYKKLYDMQVLGLIE
jgi:ATP-binding cassette subfamily B protein